MKITWFKSVIVASIFFASQTGMASNLYLSLTMKPVVGGGGTWELTCATDGHGLAGLRVLLKNISTVTMEAPRGTVNNGALAGFNVFQTSVFPGYTEVVIGQSPLYASQLISPNKQNIFYGVGSIAGGTPTSSGVAYQNLSNLVGSPWGVTPRTLGPLKTEVLLLKGTFVSGQYPLFYSQAGNTSSGNIFTAVGTSTVMGPAVVAANVRVWQGYKGDCNLDGIIDTTDHVLWNASYGGINCDFNRDGESNSADYTVWRDNSGFNINNL